MSYYCPFNDDTCYGEDCQLWIDRERRNGDCGSYIDLTAEQREAGCAFKALGLAAREYICEENRWSL